MCTCVTVECEIALRLCAADFSKKGTYFLATVKGVLRMGQQCQPAVTY